MRWTCPKCGKKLDVSNEQLIANNGVIVCPQCLLQARQPVPKARVSSRSDKSTTPPKRSRQSIDFGGDTPPEYKPSQPPPHRPRMKQASTSYRYTGLSGNGDTGTQRPATRKKTGKKKSKKKKSQGMSAWGCLGRSIVITLVLFAAYIFFGLLLEAMQ